MKLTKDKYKIVFNMIYVSRAQFLKKEVNLIVYSVLMKVNVQEDIKKIILHLKQRGIGVLITDHNVRETLDVCEHAYIVSHGELIAEGDADQILANQHVRDVYLGEQFTL